MNGEQLIGLNVLYREMKNKAIVNDSWSLFPSSPSIQLLYSSLAYITQVYYSHPTVHNHGYVSSLFLQSSDMVTCLFIYLFNNSNEMPLICVNQMKNIMLKSYACPVKWVQFTFYIFVSNTSKEKVLLKQVFF